MRDPVLLACILLASCGSVPEENEPLAARPAGAAVAAAPVTMPTDTDVSFARDTTSTRKPPAAVKSPSGTYRFVMRGEEGQNVLHTVAFYPGTFRMQEEYSKDSIVVTEGTWAPSRGFIWLYKDQVVRGRYTWKEDTLQYYSPQLKKTFSMHQLTPATTNTVWQTKRKEGKRLYGIGTEPFWSVEITTGDSIVVNMPDWSAPLRLKITDVRSATDSTVFSAGKDSLHLVVYPYFCSDGMSDFLYSRKLALRFKGQVYEGCGELLQPTH